MTESARARRCARYRVEAKNSEKTHFLLSKVKSLKICPLAILMPLEENPFIEGVQKKVDKHFAIYFDYHYSLQN